MEGKILRISSGWIKIITKKEKYLTKDVKLILYNIFI